jgi:hypothetical protein
MAEPFSSLLRRKAIYQIIQNGTCGGKRQYNGHLVKLASMQDKKTNELASREKQLHVVLLNTTGMHGDLQGIIGPSLQTIPALEAGAPGAESVV